MRLITKWFRRDDHGQGGFAVDDVEPSTEELQSVELPWAMRHKLSRAIVSGPLDGRRVVHPDLASRNPLAAAVHFAFSRHLPLTLSPDAIWLTIVQGFSHHINEHAEEMRGRLVPHQGYRELVERVGNLDAGALATAVSGFSQQIREATDPALYDALICNFTTTTAEVRTASEIAFMDTYSHYFRFTMAMCVCGIPHITLTGCADDWRRMRERIGVFETFGLDWWVSRLRPILDEFVRAAEGKPDRGFWREIYKLRPRKGPYDPEKVTGWLVDLFPYLGDGPDRRRSPVFDGKGTREVASGAFPSGLCRVGVRLEIVDNNERLLATKDLDLVGGMLGVEQSDQGVWPMISWCLAERIPAKAA
jgi:hypothetical protein